MDHLNTCPLCFWNKSDFLLSTKVQMQNHNSSFSFHKCTNCQCVFLINPPNENELHQFYGENYLPYSSDNAWGKYSKIVNFWQKYLDKKRSKLVIKNIKNLNHEMCVLDFGCGHPSFLNDLQKRTGWECHGYDFSSQGWDNKETMFGNIHLFSGNFNEIKFTQKFNIITMWHSLEHHFAPKELLFKLHSLSTENALLMIEVPNYNSISRKIQNKFWAGYHTPRHSAIYTPETISYLLENSGWKIEKIYKYGTLDAYTFWWLGEFEKFNSNKNSYKSLEKYFLHFIFFKMLYLPLFVFEKLFSFGIMTIICRKK